MDKLNLKNVLTAVRDMINRSRIAYKDYLGEETVTETKVLVDGTLSEQGTLTLKDPSFTGFVVGKEYKVTIDGTTQTLTAISNNGVGGITNITDFENPGENYFAIGIDPKKGQPICMVGGTYIGKTISISQTKTTTTKKYDIKKVPQELIPDTIARSVDVAKVKTKAYDAFNKADAAQIAADAAQVDADNARIVANNAQTAADTAKTTATNAQNTANRAATKSDPVFTGSFSQNRKEDTAIGPYSHSEGSNTTASGSSSHAEGYNTTASGYCSHAEGYFAIASGYCPHAEGSNTTASGSYSHAEGNGATASEVSSHAEGTITTASGSHSHAEGYYATASGDSSHAEGNNTTASGTDSHAEGHMTTANGDYSHSEGCSTIASGNSSHV